MSEEREGAIAKACKVVAQAQEKRLRILEALLYDEA